MSVPSWLHDAVIYNIYPQSFYDSNGDGIGDLNGIRAKLPHISHMGYTAIWLNPVYESPFRDAGYDVTDFYKIAPRYGTNEDFRALCDAAHACGLRVIMDLVAGHTALECEWFQQSARPERNAYSDRYIWTHSVWESGFRLIGGYSDRDGCYLTNFFYCQPALNYGYKNITKPWQLPMDHPACMANRQELLNIMDFWSKLGCDGFRVDMASSLVKGDPTGEGIRALWQDLRARYKTNHPDGVLIAEWGSPKDAIAAGFDVDFMLHCTNKAYTTLFRHERGTNQSENWIGDSYFRPAGKGDFRAFLDIYKEHYDATRAQGLIALPTGNHDMHRISLQRDTDDLKIAYTFLLTMPGVPFVYYGDEIGMAYLPLPSKEGAYNRTGARTPMQWDHTKHKGFSTGDTPYLPVDDRPDAPTVLDQWADPDSLLHYLRALIAQRRRTPDLTDNTQFEVVSDGYPLIFRRGRITVIVQPKDAPVEVTVPGAAALAMGVHAVLDGECVRLSGKGAAIVETA